LRLLNPDDIIQSLQTGYTSAPRVIEWPNIETTDMKVDPLHITDALKL